MLIELTLLGGGVTYWLKKKRAQKESIQPVTDLQVFEESKPSVSNSFQVTTLLKDIKNSVMTDEREQLQQTIDPSLSAAIETAQKQTWKNTKLSAGSIGLALLSKSFPILAIPSALLILYLFRGMFHLILKEAN
jgi:hypothetical protein